MNYLHVSFLRVAELLALFIYKCLMFVVINKKLFDTEPKHKNNRKTLYALPNDSKSISYQESIIVALEQYNLSNFCTIAYLQPVIFNSMAFKVEIVKLDSFENRYSAC